MSKLEELIAELCPNGVEYKTLGEIGKVSMCKRVMKAETNTSGGIPFFKIGTFGKEPDSYISHEKYNEYRMKFSFPNKGEILISAAGTIGRTVIYNGEPAYYQDSNIVWLEHDESLVFNKFLFYCYQMKPWVASTGGTIARLYNDNISKARIPVPPLPVQNEIVRILDNFTELITELTAELVARKKQYEYYREHLLNQCVISERPLRDLCEIIGRIGFRGYTRNDLRDEGHGAISFSPGNINNETIKFNSCSYVSWDKYEESPEIMVKEGDILLCKTGSTLGKVAMVEYLPEKATINPQLVVLKQIKCNSRYLKYVLGGYSFQAEIQSRKGLGSVPNISQKEIGSIMIPLHSEKEQQRIVTILDKLSQLCNDISAGLPAEIEARQKQYEYYRDKLLTFKELS